MKGDVVTLDGTEDWTSWPSGEYVVLTEPRYVSGKDKAPFGGKGYVDVRRRGQETGHLVVPVVHLVPSEPR